jgi:threonine dehydratase
MTPAELASAVLAADAALAGRIVRTPLLPMPWLAFELGTEVQGKLENVQRTGSFKLRGAMHALLALSPPQRARGVVAASSGNHGLGIATAAAELGVPATVFVPTTTPVDKRAAIAAAGAEVLVHGDDCVLTEQHARQLAAATGRTYVSPYNDPQVIAGQGTIAVELLQQWPAVETVYVAVGGGGLISGMAAHLRALRPDVEVVGCLPTASPAMARCVAAGAVIDVPCGETWSDSTAGGVEPGALTLPLCRALVDRFVEVDEEAIAKAMRDCLQRQHLLIEGAAGVAIAAARVDAARGGRGHHRRAAIVVCGGNLPWARLQQLVRSAPSYQG